MIANTLAITADHGGRWLRLRGDLNFATVDEARVDLARQMDEAQGAVVLDMREVGLLASMGIEMLLTLTRSGSVRRCVLLVNPGVEDVLRIAGVMRHFTVVRSAEEARRLAGLSSLA